MKIFPYLENFAFHRIVARKTNNDKKTPQFLKNQKKEPKFLKIRKKEPKFQKNLKKVDFQEFQLFFFIF